VPFRTTPERPIGPMARMSGLAALRPLDPDHFGRAALAPAAGSDRDRHSMRWGRVARSVSKSLDERLTGRWRVLQSRCAVIPVKSADQCGS